MYSEPAAGVVADCDRPGPGATGTVQAFTGSIIGNLILSAHVALMSHLISGLSIWLGPRLRLKANEVSKTGALIGGISLTVLV